MQKISELNEMHSRARAHIEKNIGTTRMNQNVKRKNERARASVHTTHIICIRTYSEQERKVDDSVVVVQH